MTIKLIAIDLDGTLLNSQEEISAKNKKAIQKAKKAGVHVVLCTGRPRRSMMHLLKTAGLTDVGDLVATYNGGLIQEAKTGKLISEKTLSGQESLDIFELGQHLNLPVNFIDLDYVYEPPYPQGAPSIYQKANQKVPTEHALKFIEFDPANLLDLFSINKIVMSRPGPELDAAIPHIPMSYHEKYQIYKSQDHILEFLPKSVNKGYAVRILGEHFGLAKEEIMGIGDQGNDLSLVENAGLGIAMGNAIDAVKQVADYITYSNDEDGVAHAIEKFVLTNSE